MLFFTILLFISLFRSANISFIFRCSYIGAFKIGCILPDTTTKGLCPKKDGIKIKRYIKIRMYNILNTK